MTAVELIQSHQDTVKELCLRFEVESLWLFGSALNGNWSAESSDLDFLVEYGPGYREMHPLDSLVGLKLGLESLFGRPVDVVNVKTARNTEFIEAARVGSRLIYAA